MNRKKQITKSKKQIMPNDQKFKFETKRCHGRGNLQSFGHWNFAFGIYLDFDACVLVLEF
jgi:hypothetical protein